MKTLIATLSAALAMGAIASSVEDTTVVVRTNGPDLYADGTQVLDGERYALCGSNGEFAGFNADGSLVNEDDIVFGVAPIAKDGRCKAFLFTIDKDTAAKYANYSLWMLDTRVYGDDGAVALSANTDAGKPAAVNAAAKTSALIAVTNGGAGGTAKDAVEAAVSVATGVPADAPQPVIKSIKVVGDNVEIEVENTVPYITYDVAAGDQPAADSFENGKAEAPKNGKATKTETITLVVPKAEGAQFFKVNRK